MQMNKAALDNSYAMMMSAYEQSKLMLDMMLYQDASVPPECREAIKGWSQTYSKGCKELKKMADYGYQVAETYLSPPD